jgi:uncharacterized SAM-binding protein YcdF (DUF218 family)
MPRAVRLFQQAGLNVIAQPAGFWVSEDEGFGFGDRSLEGIILAVVPDAENLAYTTRALKEYFGLAMSGWCTAGH